MMSIFLVLFTTPLHTRAYPGEHVISTVPTLKTSTGRTNSVGTIRNPILNKSKRPPVRIYHFSPFSIPIHPAASLLFPSKSPLYPRLPYMLV